MASADAGSSSDFESTSDALEVWVETGGVVPVVAAAAAAAAAAATFSLVRRDRRDCFFPAGCCCGEPAGGAAGDLEPVIAGEEAVEFVFEVGISSSGSGASSSSSAVVEAVAVGAGAEGAEPLKSGSFDTSESIALVTGAVFESNTVGAAEPTVGLSEAVSSCISHENCRDPIIACRTEFRKHELCELTNPRAVRAYPKRSIGGSPLAFNTAPLPSAPPPPPPTRSNVAPNAGGTLPPAECVGAGEAFAVAAAAGLVVGTTTAPVGAVAGEGGFEPVANAADAADAVVLGAGAGGLYNRLAHDPPAAFGATAVGAPLVLTGFGPDTGAGAGAGAGGVATEAAIGTVGGIEGPLTAEAVSAGDLGGVAVGFAPFRGGDCGKSGAGAEVTTGDVAGCRGGVFVTAGVDAAPPAPAGGLTAFTPHRGKFQSAGLSAGLDGAEPVGLEGATGGLDAVRVGLAFGAVTGAADAAVFDTGKTGGAAVGCCGVCCGERAADLVAAVVTAGFSFGEAPALPDFVAGAGAGAGTGAGAGAGAVTGVAGVGEALASAESALTVFVSAGAVFVVAAAAAEPALASGTGGGPAT